MRDAIAVATRHARATAVLFLALPLCTGAQQRADPGFDATVARPALTERRPRIAVDQAHNNFHTAAGRYAPFAALIRNDGAVIDSLTGPATAGSLAGLDVLVISNALAPGATGEASRDHALTDAECDAIVAWVRQGGSLLLVADHAPFGFATASLARRFGVDFGGGFAYDTANALAGSGPSMIVHEGSRLGVHPIMQGRDSTERITRVVAFTGQSMTLPAGATPLLMLSPTAMEAPTRADVAAGRATSVAGRVQGLALTLGQGRVVMLGEAAMLSAQLAGGAVDAYGAPFRMGMNHPGTDDRQFALNVVRWLAGVLH